MRSKPKFSTLFILGLGHSGSTLLGKMLGCHPDVVFVGELLRLEQALADSEHRCSCGDSVTTCPVWRRRIESLPPVVKTDFRHWTWELIERLRMTENKALLVDSSKSRVLRLKSKWNSPQAGYVLVVRDPRGALRSVLQRKGELSKPLKTAAKWMQRFEKFSRQHPSVCLTMFYEDLVTSPEAELERLCAFLGLRFTQAMLRPNQQPFHLVRASRSPYSKGTDGLKLDERWQSALASEQLEAIGHHLGKLPIYRERYGLGRVGTTNTVGGWFANLLKKSP